MSLCFQCGESKEKEEGVVCSSCLHFAYENNVSYFDTNFKDKEETYSNEEKQEERE